MLWGSTQAPTAELLYLGAFENHLLTQGACLRSLPTGHQEPGLHRLVESLRSVAHKPRKPAYIYMTNIHVHTHIYIYMYMCRHIFSYSYEYI